MIEVVRTDEFDAWLRKLKDKQGKLRILERVDRLAHGSPGDVKPVGQGASELRLTEVVPGLVELEVAVPRLTPALR